MRDAVNRQLFILPSATDLTFATDGYYYCCQVNGRFPLRLPVNVDKRLTARVENDF
jgi:hypothetical protein